MIDQQTTRSQPLTKKRLTPKCQLYTIPAMSEGLVETGPISLPRKIKFWFKRNLSASNKKKLKRISNRLMDIFFSKHNSNNGKEGTNMSESIKVSGETKTEIVQSVNKLKAGDLVRVRTREEIEATLDHWDELKGCMVMKDMWHYCGTTQRVFKVVERFVDERDYRLKKSKGIILLQGLICQGTEDYGQCDRSCFYFWREEWLEKINEQV